MTPDNERHWYVAYVKPFFERKIADELTSLLYSVYLPVQQEIRQWSDRKKIVDRLVIPRILFIHSTAAERERLLRESRYHEYIHFLCKSGPRTPAVVPDKEMNSFMKMVNHGRMVTVTDYQFSKGDRVRVTSGPLIGLECELLSVDGRRCLAVNLSGIGTATMDLDMESIEKIKK